jgi:alkylation response protein AidB-like acyl-CoA dehydrogenase
MSVELFPEATHDQRIMADSVIRAMEAACPPAAVRESADQKPGEGSTSAGEKLWPALGGLGCFGLLASEDDGGGSLSGNGIVDAAIIAAERGARLQPGPFVGTQVAVASLSRLASRTPLQDDALAALIAGEAAATWAAGGVLADPGAPGLTVTEAADGGLTVSGLLAAVQDAAESDWILVSARDGGGVRQFLLGKSAAGLSLERLTSLDITRRHCNVVLDNVQVPADAVLAGPAPAGGLADGTALADWQLAVAAVLSAAESAGAMHANFALAVEYAKTRIAFGRPIGSFQGLKHLLARTSLALEMAKAVTAGAAQKLGDADADGLVMASIARAFVSENAVELTHTCFQVFGGIGFTWEHDQHLYMRRLASEAYLFGAPAWHRQRIWKESANA